MARPSPESILKHHEILAGVMKGEIDSRAKRAQDAYRIATRYPLVDVPVEPIAVQETPVQTTGQEQMLRTLFGVHAPHATKVLVQANTPTGRKIAGSAIVIVAALLAAKVTR